MIKYKKIISSVLTFALAATSFVYPITASAKDNNDDSAKHKTLDRLIEKSLNYEEKTEPVAPVNRALLSYDDVPNDKYASKYVSEYYSKEIKDQIPYGTCWSFAFCAASESSVRKKFGDNADFSEFHVAYFSSPGGGVVDPLGLTKGDSFKRNHPTTHYLDIGGDQETAYYNAASWKGVVDEETAPYYLAAWDKDAKLDDSLAFEKDAYYLSNCNVVSFRDKESVKDMIVKYGSVTGSYHSADKYYNLDNLWETKEPVAEYCPPSEPVANNHAINIIGWDDNYSRLNFGTYKPTGNGAWLCKNSWGSDWSKDGLFYISYEDGPLLNYSNAYAYDFVKTDKYDYNYHYDGGVATRYYGAKGANIYKATSNQQLKAVGYFTHESNMTVTVKAYTNVTAGKPTSGTLVESKTFSQPYSGYHTYELSNVINLSKDSLYSVIVEYKSEDPYSANSLVPLDVNKKETHWENKVVANSGESYVMTSTGSSWIEMDNSLDRGNCRIKALTVDCSSPKILIKSISLNKSTVDLMRNNKFKLSASLSPSNASNKSLRWKSSNMKVAAVDANGVITAFDNGSATITCYTKDGSEKNATCVVNVYNSLSDCKIVLPAKAYDYTGKAIRPEVKVLNRNGNVVDKSSYKVVYSNNVEPGTAGIVVTGINGCWGECYANFDIKPAALKINQINNTKTGILVTWNKSPKVNEYRLYRSEAGKSFTLIKQLSDCSFEDKTAKNGIKYSYKIVGCKNGVVGRDSNVETIVRLSPNKIASIESSKPKTLKIKWKKNTKATKYIISYSTDAKFKKNVKTVKVSKSKTSKTITKLKSKKTYYVRIKVEKTVNGKVYQSVWSSVKKVKVK